MGQGSSQPERRSNHVRPARRPSALRHSIHGMPPDQAASHDSVLADQHTAEPQPLTRHRPNSVARMLELMHMDPNFSVDPPVPMPEPSWRSQMLQRTRSTFRDMLSRRDHSRNRHGTTADALHGGILHHRASYVRAGFNPEMGGDFPAPRVPHIDYLSSHGDQAARSYDESAFNLADREAQHLSPTGRTNLRLNSLLSERPFRRFASLRRRRSPNLASQRAGAGEDQAAMLSRLLSVAAAATAATLVGDDHDAIAEARSLTGGTGFGDTGGSGEDGSFDGFLRALQNGRIASTLRAGADAQAGSAEPGQHAPLNFFRMFRFGSSSRADSGADIDVGPRSDEHGATTDDRMVPVIIVGIRSISPNSDPTAGSDGDLPPFIDALGDFPPPLPTHALGHDSIDSILRPPQNGTSFHHRRRASMGGSGASRNILSDRMDDQRDHRSPEHRRERPWSVASSTSAYEPRPPPVTPASPSPELSRISTRHSSPNHSRPASIVASSVRDFSSDSRRNSILHRSSAASPLSAHTEETTSLHSAQSSTNLLSSQDAERFGRNGQRRSDILPNVHYPRFASGHPRRNGVVEPDNLPQLSRTSTSDETDGSSNDRRGTTDNRSWIIYVLGGSYPENHPLLTTPSLFTENPTYEDMMLLSALLGPAKPSVASDEDVQSAGGVYSIELSQDAAKTAQLVAVATEGGGEPVLLEQDQRCLVCLCDFEVHEVARKLIKCKHLFHKECIDQWLTQGRNSCPLCRGQGVDEKDIPADSPDAASTSAETTISELDSNPILV